MSNRYNLDNYALASLLRSRSNKNFKELLESNFIVGWDINPSNPVGSTVQTVSYRTPTNVKYPDLTVPATSSVAIDGTETILTLPVVADPDTSSDSSGSWTGVCNVAWDNNVSGLQTHMRKLTFQVELVPGFWLPAGQSTMLFDPAMLTSPIDNANEEGFSIQSVYFFGSFQTEVKLRVLAWHNAKVAGSGVSLNLKKAGRSLGVCAPLLMLTREKNFTDS